MFKRAHTAKSGHTSYTSRRFSWLPGEEKRCLRIECIRVVLALLEHRPMLAEVLYTEHQERGRESALK